jgi:hypothetical protein
MRRLSARQSVSCETAATARCRCRCGGQLHGAGRFATAGEAYDLSRDDPHAAARDRATAGPWEGEPLPGLTPEEVAW